MDLLLESLKKKPRDGEFSEIEREFKILEEFSCVTDTLVEQSTSATIHCVGSSQVAINEQEIHLD